MGLSPSESASIAATIDNTANNFATGSINKATRKFNEKWAHQNRQWALDDYHMQNAYNHPSAVMARLREAKLNPNLVYGHGSAAESAAPVRSGTTPNWSPEALRFNNAAASNAGLMAYYDMEVKQAQIDNLRTQNTVLTNEAILKSAQALNLTTSTQKTKFDLELAGELRQTSVDAAKAALNKVYADTKYTLDHNERSAAITASDLRTAAERILNMRSERATNATQRAHIKQQIENLKVDKRLKELDENLKKNGVQPGDNLFFRALGQYLNSSDGKPLLYNDDKQKAKAMLENPLLPDDPLQF